MSTFGQPRQVAFLNDHLAEGGAEHSMAKIINQLAPCDDLSLTLFLLENKQTFAISECVSVQPFRAGFRCGALGKLWALPLDACRLARRIRRGKIDAVCSFQHRANWVNVLAKWIFRAPHYCVISERVHVREYYRHKTFCGIARGPLRRILAGAAQFMIRWLYKRADLVTCNARDTQTCLVEEYEVPKDRLRIIPNGYDEKRILTLAAEPVEFRDQAFFDNDRATILHVGRLCRQKGLDLLLRAFAKLEQGNRYQLLLIGNGPWEAYLKQLSQSLGIAGRVHFLGYRDNPYAYIKQADCFAFPSRYEGYPNALAEAMICNVPVVAFNFKAGSDELLEGGRYGALVPLGDVDALSKALAGHRAPSRRSFLTEEENAAQYGKILRG